ncbi:hypothetical protein [Allosphingosinicella deserti]|uniref:hypothetical protein n=1 Tax=Allosphingosinicella deserti TaxID=2116704 RepID=UPI001E337DFA|nr:hypothetical protein [Sphingomonas deserti]
MAPLDQIAPTFGDEAPDHVADDRETQRDQQVRQTLAGKHFAGESAIQGGDGGPEQAYAEFLATHPEPVVEAGEAEPPQENDREPAGNVGEIAGDPARAQRRQRCVADDEAGETQREERKQRCRQAHSPSIAEKKPRQQQEGRDGSGPHHGIDLCEVHPTSIGESEGAGVRLRCERPWRRS